VRPHDTQSDLQVAGAIAWWRLEEHGGGSPPWPDVSLFVGEVPPARAVLRAFDVLVVQVFRLGDSRIRGSVAKVLQYSDRPPALLFTSLAPENARHLARVPCDDLAFEGDPIETVLERARTLSRTTERHRMIRLLSSRGRLGPKVHPTVVRALMGSPPVHQVQDLAGFSLVSRRTLEKRWAEIWGPGPIPPLKRFLDWAVLLRAREIYRRSVPLGQLSRALRVNNRTFRRLRRRLGGEGEVCLLELGTEALFARIEWDLFRERQVHGESRFVRNES